MEGDASLSGAAAAAVSWPIDIADRQQDAEDAMFFSESPYGHDSVSSDCGDLGAWLSDGPSTSTSFDGDGAAAAAAAAAPPVLSRVQLPDVRAKKKRRNFGGATLSAEEVEALMDKDHDGRPLVLDLSRAQEAECGGWVFKETGKIIRPPDPRADKWRRGGGAGAATDLPNSLVPRVRRRYGYVVPAAGSPRLRYHQYCRLILPAKDDGRAQSGGDSANVVEDSQTWLYHVLSELPPVVPLAPTLTTSLDDHPRITQVLGTLHVQAESKPVAAGTRDALLRLSAPDQDVGQTIEFVRFEAGGRELGGIYNAEHGLQLRSAAGDFAEWHPALNREELPYAEGSVVGLSGGKILLRTVDADMVAVVSRRALCVGSFPGSAKAVDGDVIAYLGQVPVRVRGRVAAGDTLVPSMRHDGTAVAWQDETKTGTRGNAPRQIIGIAMSGYSPGDNSGDMNDADIGTVDALITPPSAQEQRHQRRQAVDPALEFMAYQHRSAKRRRGTCLQAWIAVLVAAIGLVLTLMYVRPPNSSRCGGADCGGGSVHPQSPAADEDLCNAASCEPGNCTVLGTESHAANLQRVAESSVQTAAFHGAAEARCSCPEGFSSKMSVGFNGTALPSCERNLCTTARSSLVDPLASHTVQWANGLRVLQLPCTNVRSFELCQFSCDPGYLPMGDALCLPNGTIVGGGCMPDRCKPLAIPHSDRSHGNECTGFTGDTCNFTCANGYRRAQAQTPSGVAQAEGMGPLQCVAPTQEFLSEFAFAISGANDSAYNGLYTMTDKTCHNRAVWQKQQVKGGAAVVDGPVLFARELLYEYGPRVPAPHNTFVYTRICMCAIYARYLCKVSI